MSCYIISCTLNAPGRDYLDLAEAIAGLGEAWPFAPATWLLSTDTHAAEIRDALKPHLGAADQMLVAELSGEAAWRGADGRLSAALNRIFAGARQS